MPRRVVTSSSLRDVELSIPVGPVMLTVGALIRGQSQSMLSLTHHTQVRVGSGEQDMEELSFMDDWHCKECLFKDFFFWEENKASL